MHHQSALGHGPAPSGALLGLRTTGVSDTQEERAPVRDGCPQRVLDGDEPLFRVDLVDEAAQGRDLEASPLTGSGGPLSGGTVTAAVIEPASLETAAGVHALEDEVGRRGRLVEARRLHVLLSEPSWGLDLMGVARYYD